MEQINVLPAPASNLAGNTGAAHQVVVQQSNQMTVFFTLLFMKGFGNKKVMSESIFDNVCIHGGSQLSDNS